MKLELDESLARRAAELLREAGHDVATVVDQALSVASDDTVLLACGNKRRCLITLDVEFANPLRYPPSANSGIVVLRGRPRMPTASLADLLGTFSRAIAKSNVDGKLWIVEPGRIREYGRGDV